MQVTFLQWSPKLIGRSYEKSSVSEWHKQFKVGHKNVEDDELSGHPRSHRVKKM
jgi:hypothetical protein